MATLDRVFVCDECTVVLAEARDKDACPACGNDETETVENLDGELVERADWFTDHRLAEVLA